MEFPHWLTFITSWLCTTWFIYRPFDKAEDIVKKESKDLLANLLLNLPSDKNQNMQTWLSIFLELFDKVFGEKHLSWFCFKRSSIASIFFFAICLSFFILLFEVDIPKHPIAIILLLPFPFLFNILIDYISLLETRCILGIISKKKSLLSKIIYSIIDILFSYFIFCFIAMLITKLIVLTGANFGILSYTTDNNSLWNWFKATIQFEILKDKVLLIYAGLSTTFLTSLWIWFYLLGGVIIKILNGGFGTIGFFQKHINIAEKPFKAIGAVLICIISVFYIIWGVNLFFIE